MLICAAVGVVVLLPVVITVVQALQGGVSAAKTAITASSTPRLLLHTVELAAWATLSPSLTGFWGAAGIVTFSMIRWPAGLTRKLTKDWAAQAGLA